MSWLLAIAGLVLAVAVFNYVLFECQVRSMRRERLLEDALFVPEDWAEDISSIRHGGLGR